ncbi:MAG: pantetheine-phosphate adenylyltransferase [Spirochaetes bacterium GWF1_49_6]|jgi:pantetheine-phosphate adenylyltransferase|nr:MAG: pantetheine-phosphate adenylyltransferase [Spirochaetes bacterium GWF1_49_6]
MQKIGVYPGTFDPPTNGHIDVAIRASHFFDTLIIGVGNNPGKNPLFSADERVAMLEEIFKDSPNIEIRPFSNLLINFVSECGAMALVRGLRAVSDFEYELQLASFNYHLNDTVDTVFFMAREENLFVSSSIIREIAQYGGDVSDRVPPVVWKKLRAVYPIK